MCSTGLKKVHEYRYASALNLSQAGNGSTRLEVTCSSSAGVLQFIFVWSLNHLQMTLMMRSRVSARDALSRRFAERHLPESWFSHSCCHVYGI